MSRLNACYALDDEQYQRYCDAIFKATGNVEDKINNYLHNEGIKAAGESITKYLPVSKKGKKHAKYSDWYAATPVNLGFAITSKKPYWYLCFVNEGSGTSQKSGGVPFIDMGMNNITDTIINNLIKVLDDTFDKEV